METISWILHVKRSEINYLRVTIESYDGMALVRTVDPYTAQIELLIAPGCEELVSDLLKNLREDEKIRIHEAQL